MPVTWPIGNGLNFEGIYDILKNEVHLYKAGKTIPLGSDGVFGPELESEIAGYNLSALRDEIELIQGAGNDSSIISSICPLLRALARLRPEKCSRRMNFSADLFSKFRQT